MVLTLTVSEKVLAIDDDFSTNIEAWIDGLSITTIYGYTCVALSNTKVLLTILYA